jgi:hypothetical protein
MHRRSLLASEKKTVSAVSSTASAERPILSPSKGQTALNSRNSAAPAFITRSNNPYSASSNKQENSKQENSKQEISKPKTTRRSRSRGKQKETSDSSSTETSGTFFPF